MIGGRFVDDRYHLPRSPWDVDWLVDWPLGVERC
jgi:hypothetical protein